MGCIHKSLISNTHTMMRFIFFFETTQNRDCVGYTRFAHKHLLEATFKCSIFLHMLTIFIERCSTNQSKLTTCKHWFEKIGCIHCTISFTSTKHQVNLINKQDHFSLSLFYFFQQAFQTFFKLTTVFGTSNERAHINRDETAIEIFWNITTHNTLCKTFNNRSLAHTWRAYQYRVVLCTSREHLNNTSNLFITANHRIKFTFFSEFDKILTKLLQSFI
mmetsp:Transcript_436/g.587  ORF Transcript_436/g.587 Transcript_436/m.587 type:complete len:218 (+) Transcript_436:1583-2236(+)